MKSKLNKKAKKAVDAYKGNKEDGVINDVLGMYTGRPAENEKECPVQDADDL